MAGVDSLFPIINLHPQIRFHHEKRGAAIPNHLDLVDFQSVLAKDGHEIDYTNLIIKGAFEEADIELAKAVYKAIAIEENQ